MSKFFSLGGMLSSISPVILFQLQNRVATKYLAEAYVCSRGFFPVGAHQCKVSFLPGNLQDGFIKWWDIVNTNFNPNTSPALCRSSSIHKCV